MRHSFESFYTNIGLASQSGCKISWINLAAKNFMISFLMAAYLSAEKHSNHCLIGLEPSFKSIMCSANFLGTPSMSVGFQAKISLLSQRKLVSRNSYSLGRWELMVAILEGSPAPRSIFMTSASLGRTRMVGFLAGNSKSSGLAWLARVAISPFLSLPAPWMQSW
jgi:hypothetical protein